MNKKGGRKSPATPEDIEIHGKAVGTRIINFFSLIEREYLDPKSGEENYLMISKHILIDSHDFHFN